MLSSATRTHKDIILLRTFHEQTGSGERERGNPTQRKRSPQRLVMDKPRRGRGEKPLKILTFSASSSLCFEKLAVGPPAVVAKPKPRLFIVSGCPEGTCTTVTKSSHAKTRRREDISRGDAETRGREVVSRRREGNDTFHCFRVSQREMNSCLEKLRGPLGATR